MTARPDETPLDPLLSAALRHAPDRDAQPAPELDARILREAHAALNPRTTGPARPAQGLWLRLLDRLTLPSLAGALGTVVMATVIGLMWRDGPPPEPAAEQRAEREVAARDEATGTPRHCRGIEGPAGWRSRGQAGRGAAAGRARRRRAPACRHTGPGQVRGRRIRGRTRRAGQGRAVRNPGDVGAARRASARSRPCSGSRGGAGHADAGGQVHALRCRRRAQHRAASTGSAGHACGGTGGSRIRQPGGQNA